MGAAAEPQAVAHLLVFNFDFLFCQLFVLGQRKVPVYSVCLSHTVPQLKLAE